MTRDDIIRMAKEAGFEPTTWQLSFGYEACGTHEAFERFAKLVAAAERQAIIDEFQKWHRSDKDRHSHWLHVINYIQGRGQA